MDTNILFKIKPELKLINWLDPRHFLSLGFGSGLIPIAPGTFGSLAAIPVYWLMATYLSLSVYLAVTLVFAIVGFYLCGFTAQALKTHDHPGIVWDEVVGMLIALAFFPVTWKTVVIGFIYFRIFDIIKPWPINWLDRRVSGGVGIMADDLLAGVMAWITLYLTHTYIYSLY
ncbi:phosphatidylglycerophosphatase A [Gayadomonas joobiniege]|uniref:phosphatidylglycerophosphatase A family protein n=1 Tax=Gayadomonas joobiniege TaxID=1234606 RepID=UPI00035C13D3|nr:phosphatidylglycerophosphatase A [Gayadomonas joobiniege]